MPRWLPICLFALALTAALWRAPLPDLPAFQPEPEIAVKSPGTELFSEKINEASGTVGSSTLAQLPDGRLIIAWQENRTEDEADTALRLVAQDKQGNWGKAQEVANRALVAGNSFAYLSQLGRPLLYAEGNWLHLWFTSHAISDWRSAALIHRFSSDGGNAWSAPRKTAIAAGFNPGGLRLAPPTSLNAGELALPLQENDGSVRSWLRLAATGQPLDKTRLPSGHILLTDGPVAVNLPAGAESVLKLSGTDLIAAGNPEGNRKILQLWQSNDGGRQWTAGRIIEQADDGAADFSYPFLLQARDGQIHLTYTWRRQGIRHLSFSTAWLNGKGGQ